MKTTFAKYLKEDHYGSLVDKDRYNSLGRADQKLYKYTADGMTSLGSVMDELVNDYPFAGGTVYRGLHFDTQEQHDNFMNEIESGSLKLLSPSSWSSHKETADEFSRTKKTYFPTREIMDAETKRNETGDHMSGYGGVIIKTKVDKNIAVDVSKSDFSKESEVILPKGTYEVEIESLSEPHHRKYDTPEKVNTIIDQLTKAKERSPKLNELYTYVMKSWLKKLDQEQIDKMLKYDNINIFGWTDDKFKQAVSYKVDDNHFNDSLRIRLHMYFPFDIRLYNLASDTMKKKIDGLCKKLLKNLEANVKQLVDEPNFDQVDEFSIDGVEHMKKFLPSETEKAVAPLKKALGKKYHQLNDRNTTKALKDMESIRKHGEKVEKVIKAIMQL